MITSQWVLLFFVSIQVILVQGQLLSEITHLVTSKTLTTPEHREPSNDAPTVSEVTHADSLPHASNSPSSIEQPKNAITTQAPPNTSSLSSIDSPSSSSNTQQQTTNAPTLSPSPPSSSPPPPPPPPTTMTTTTSNAQTSSDNTNHDTTTTTTTTTTNNNKPTKEPNRATNNASPTASTTRVDKDQKTTKSSEDNAKATSKTTANETRSSETNSNDSKSALTSATASPSTNITNATKETNNDDGSIKTGSIVGAIVGSILGVAFIGGLISWVNRRGGCARRKNNKRSIEYEDFGLADTDFPQNQTPNMAFAPHSHETINPLPQQGNYYHVIPEEPQTNQSQYETKYLPPDEIGNDPYYHPHERSTQAPMSSYYGHQTNHHYYPSY